MFHAHCGEYVRLTNGGKTAVYNGGIFGAGSGVLLSQEPLTPGVPFKVRVDNIHFLTQVARLTIPPPMVLGVTGVNPDTRPHLPGRAIMMEKSFMVRGSSLYREGKEEGTWPIDLQATTGAIVSIEWDGADVYITWKGTKARVFSSVSGPLWAVSHVWPGMYQLSVIPQETTSGENPKPDRRPDIALASRSGPSEPDLTRTMNEMAVGDLAAQSMKASGILIPKRTSSTRITCLYWSICNRFIDTLQLPDIYFDTQYDACYCTDCTLSRGDNLYYTRGEPPKTYGLPLGWCRFGLCVPVRAHALGAFELWHVAYHGTIPKNIQKILESDLLMPGDHTLDGVQVAPPSGHFTETRKPAGFDIKQVFVSPTITYAGHGAYAKPQRWTDSKTGKVIDVQVALQVKIKPDSYTVGKETLGLGSKKIDAKFDNSELEWSTKLRGATIPYGILVKHQ